MEEDDKIVMFGSRLNPKAKGKAPRCKKLDVAPIYCNKGNLSSVEAFLNLLQNSNLVVDIRGHAKCDFRTKAKEICALCLMRSCLIRAEHCRERLPRGFPGYVEPREIYPKLGKFFGPAVEDVQSSGKEDLFHVITSFSKHFNETLSEKISFSTVKDYFTNKLYVRCTNCNDLIKFSGENFLIIENSLGENSIEDCLMDEGKKIAQNHECGQSRSLKDAEQSFKIEIENQNNLFMFFPEGLNWILKGKDSSLRISDKVYKYKGHINWSHGKFITTVDIPSNNGENRLVSIDGKDIFAANHNKPLPGVFYLFTLEQSCDEKEQFYETAYNSTSFVVTLKGLAKQLEWEGEETLKNEMKSSYVLKSNLDDFGDVSINQKSLKIKVEPINDIDPLQTTVSEIIEPVDLVNNSLKRKREDQTNDSLASSVVPKTSRTNIIKLIPQKLNSTKMVLVPDKTNPSKMVLVPLIRNPSKIVLIKPNLIKTVNPPNKKTTETLSNGPTETLLKQPTDSKFQVSEKPSDQQSELELSHLKVEPMDPLETKNLSKNKKVELMDAIINQHETENLSKNIKLEPVDTLYTQEAEPIEPIEFVGINLESIKKEENFSQPIIANKIENMDKTSEPTFNIEEDQAIYTLSNFLNSKYRKGGENYKNIKLNTYTPMGRPSYISCLYIDENIAKIISDHIVGKDENSIQNRLTNVISKNEFIYAKPTLLFEIELEHRNKNETTDFEKMITIVTQSHMIALTCKTPNGSSCIHNHPDVSIKMQYDSNTDLGINESLLFDFLQKNVPINLKMPTNLTNFKSFMMKSGINFHNCIKKEEKEEEYDCQCQPYIKSEYVRSEEKEDAINQIETENLSKQIKAESVEAVQLWETEESFHNSDREAIENGEKEKVQSMSTEEFATLSHIEEMVTLSQIEKCRINGTCSCSFKKCKIRQKERIKNMSIEELAAKREKERERIKKWRQAQKEKNVTVAVKKGKIQKMTKEEKETHQKEKEREKWRRRKEALKEKKLNMSSEELTAIKDKEKEKKEKRQQKIKNMSTEEWDAEKEKARERKKIWRQAQKEKEENASTEEVAVQKESMSTEELAAKKETIKNMSPEELAAKNEKERERMKKWREAQKEKEKSMSSEEVAVKKEKKREKQREQIKKWRQVQKEKEKHMDPEEVAVKKQKCRIRQREKIKNMSTEELAARRDKCRIRQNRWQRAQKQKVQKEKDGNMSTEELDYIKSEYVSSEEKEEFLYEPNIKLEETEGLIF